MHRFTTLLILAAALCTRADAVEIKLSVTETEGVGRTPAAITTGIPFAEGALANVDKLAVKQDGKVLPAQFLKTVSWPDGSVRWALMDVQVPVAAKGKVELVVSDAGGNVAPPKPVEIEDGADAVTVSTGPLRLVVPKKKPGLIESIQVDGKDRVTGAGKGFVVVTEDGKEHQAGAPTEVKVEQAGPLRALIYVRGAFPGVHNDLLTYTARLTVHAGSRAVKAHVWLENNGAIGFFSNLKGKHWTDAVSPRLEWFPFKGARVDLGLGLGDQPTVQCEGVEGKGRLRVEQKWYRVKPGFKRHWRHGPFYTAKDWEYTVDTGGEKPHKGLRTDGVVHVAGDGATLTVAIRNFWQEWPKAIGADGKTLSLQLWPVGGRWPIESFQHRWYPDLNKIGKFDGYWLQGGAHKGHELVLDFSDRSEKECHAELAAPLFAFAPGAYYAATEAAPGLFGAPEQKTPNRIANIKLACWNRMARNALDPASDSGVHMAMRGPYGLGWMNYGDLCVFAAGHVGLHQDWTYIALLDAIRLGDTNALKLGATMARHRIDVDQMWSDRDFPHLNGLQVAENSMVQFHVGHLPRQHPSLGANWLSGAVLHYMLTGEPKARECALRNGEGMRRAVKAKACRDIGDGAWTISNFLALYRVTADKAWLDDALGVFRDRIVKYWEWNGPFLHRAGDQFRGQSYVKEDVAYCYAIAPLCELHYLTGDKKVMELLQAGCAKEFPSTSFYGAPLFLSDLYAYVGLKTKNAELLTKGAKAFGQAFPLSKCPPTYQAGVARWSADKAMVLRAGHALQFAAGKAKVEK